MYDIDPNGRITAYNWRGCVAAQINNYITIPFADAYQPNQAHTHCALFARELARTTRLIKQLRKLIGESSDEPALALVQQMNDVIMCQAYATLSDAEDSSPVVLTEEERTEHLTPDAENRAGNTLGTTSRPWNLISRCSRASNGLFELAKRTAQIASTEMTAESAWPDN